MNHGGNDYGLRTTTTRKPERYTPRVFKASDFTVTTTLDKKVAIRAPCGEMVILSAHEAIEMMLKLNNGLKAIE